MCVRDSAQVASGVTLPEGLEAYRRTPIFTEESVPGALRRAHSTKAGVWGLIHVLAGELLYHIVDARREAATYVLTPASAPGIVEPEILHEVEPSGRVRFQVEFLRPAGFS
jgi:tellurite resistance-related uncharacterized protein